MPIESIIVSAAVIAVFVVFTSVMFWADKQTSGTGPKDIGGRPRHRAF